MNIIMQKANAVYLSDIYLTSHARNLGGFVLDLLRATPGYHYYPISFG